MNRIKQGFQQFCISTTGSLIGILITNQVINHKVVVRHQDLWALMLACFLIILVGQIIYAKESHSKKGYWAKIILHYLTALIILFGIGRRMEWLGLEKNQNIFFFGAVVTIIYMIVLCVSVSWNYQTSKRINEALGRYHRNENKK